MTNPNDPTVATEFFHGVGLSKREFFAAQALIGVMAEPIGTTQDCPQYSPEDAARRSVAVADALIAALNRGENK